MRGVEQAVDESFPGTRAVVTQEGGDLFGGRGQAGEIETDPADERSTIGGWRGRQPAGGQSGQNEAIDRCAAPV